MQFSDAIKYGTTYTVNIQVLYNGVYQTQGSSCTITTPASITPTTKLVDSSCGKH